METKADIMFDGEEQRHNYDERLRNIEQVLVKLSAEIERDNKSRDEWRQHVAESIDKLMDLFIRVDRLEQDRKRSEKIEGLAWASGIGLVFKVLWDIIVSHLK